MNSQINILLLFKKGSLFAFKHAYVNKVFEGDFLLRVLKELE